MIGTQFDGPGEGPLHMVPQAGSLNRGAGSQWTAMEREWENLLIQGHKVSVKIDIVWTSASSKRPTSFDVTYTVTHGVTGRQQIVTRSFPNQ